MPFLPGGVSWTPKSAGSLHVENLFIGIMIDTCTIEQDEELMLGYNIILLPLWPASIGQSRVTLQITNNLACLPATLYRVRVLALLI